MYPFSVLREEDKSRKLWFGQRSGGFEEVKEGIAPTTVNVPELLVISYVFSSKPHQIINPNPAKKDNFKQRRLQSHDNKIT